MTPRLEAAQTAWVVLRGMDDDLTASETELLAAQTALQGMLNIATTDYKPGIIREKARGVMTSKNPCHLL